jgi:hypothetical protein
MTKLAFVGAEIDDTTGASEIIKTVGTITRDTGIFRSGAASYKCDSGAGVGACFRLLNPATGGSISCANSATTYARAYMRFDNAPGSDVRVFGTDSTAADGISARLTTGGKLQLWNNVTPAQIGSDSAATLAVDGSAWYRLEFFVTKNASAQITDCELRLDGTTVASTTGVTITNSSNSVQAGWFTTPGASKICYVDDVSVNNSSGAVNNSWPGNGKVVLLLPISDNAIGTGWTTSGGAGSNLFACVDNTPPTGIADTTANEGHQVRNATSNANSNYDANLTSYTTAGVGAGDTINAVLPLTWTAAPVSTGAKQGTFGVVSNPAITNVALSSGGVAGAFWSGAAAGTWLTGWKLTAGTLTEAPSVTLGTSPVIRITQVTSSTRIAICCFMAMYVDYTPLAVTNPPPLVTERMNVAYLSG